MFDTRDPLYNMMGSVGMSMVLSLVGMLLMFLATVYIQEVKPGKYGAARHPLFFIMASVPG